MHLKIQFSILIISGRQKVFDSSRTIYFRKQFSITSPIAKARLQAIIGNVGIIYINGQRVGQVSSRFSQSILKLQHNIETFDILPYLNEGNNVIAVKPTTISDQSVF